MTGTRRRDPLGIDAELQLRARYYPAGFLLQLVTNSPEVIEAAEEAWSHYPDQVYPCDPVELRVAVRKGGVLCREPVHRAQGHMYSAISDVDNVATLDLHTLSGAIFVSEATARDHGRLRWCFLESLAYMLLAQRSVVPVHAACVARHGQGLLLCGGTMAGKSTLAYACARSGWDYLSDDAVFLLPDSLEPAALGLHRQIRFRPDARLLFPELEALPVTERPNGRDAIEAQVRDLPLVHTADRTQIVAVVQLERRSAGPAEGNRLVAGELTDLMLKEMPSYGPEVNAMHERTVGRLAEVSAYRLCYSALDAALARLAEITEAAA